MTTKVRLTSELLQLRRHPIPGITIHDVSDNLDKWIIDIEGAPDTLYAGEKFQLQFKFRNGYPFYPPEVIFTGDHIPIHPHIDGNGHIGFSFLTPWSPALSVRSVCLSILSVLSSCKQKTPGFNHTALPLDSV